MQTRSYYFFVSNHRQSLRDIMLARMRPHNAVVGMTPIMLDGSLQGPYNDELSAYSVLRLTDKKHEACTNNPSSGSELNSARVKFFVVEMQKPCNKPRVIDNIEKIYFLNPNSVQDYDRMAENNRSYQALMYAYSQAMLDHQQDPQDKINLELANIFKEQTESMEEEMRRRTRYITSFTQHQLRKAFVPQELKHRVPRKSGITPRYSLFTPGFSSFMHTRDDARKEMEIALKMADCAHENQKPRRKPSIRNLY